VAGFDGVSLFGDSFPLLDSSDARASPVCESRRHVKLAFSDTLVLSVPSRRGSCGPPSAKAPGPAALVVPRRHFPEICFHRNTPRLPLPWRFFSPKLRGSNRFRPPQAESQLICRQSLRSLVLNVRVNDVGLCLADFTRARRYPRRRNRGVTTPALFFVNRRYCFVALATNCVFPPFPSLTDPETGDLSTNENSGARSLQSPRLSLRRYPSALFSSEQVVA